MMSGERGEGGGRPDPMAGDALQHTSTNRYRKLFELEPDAILLIDNESGRILEANAAASHVYGYTPEELRARYDDDLSPEPGATSRAADAEHVRGSFIHVPLRLQRKKDGTVFPAEITGRFFDDDGRPVHMITVRDITARRQADRELQESEERFRTILEHAPDSVYVQVEGLFAYTNAAAVRLFAAASPFDLLGLHVLDRAHPDYRDRVRERIRITNEEGRPVPPMEQVYVRLNGSSVPVEVSATPITYLGKPASLVFARDITHRKRLETGLAQVQQLDSIRQVAGGIAHDFNNMLNVIGGYTELALTRLRADDPLRTQLQEVKQASDRAAELTRQLLAFSRPQSNEPRLVDLNQHLQASEGMMRRLLGESVTLRLQLSPTAVMARVDPEQLEQVLVNLLSNARDAIAGVGTVHVETQTVTLGDSQGPSTPQCGPGQYVELSVTDNGCGMNEATRAHVFEPFFTTKGASGATGLGLAVVYGVVTQHLGGVGVSSEPGRGATFQVYLPRQEAARLPGLGSATVLPHRGFGHEVVVVVEDEDQVRRLVVTALERSGYSVLQAASPDAALDLVRQTQGVIDMLLTDVVMPGMDGAELQRRMLRLRPGIRTLFMSGYSSNIIGNHGVLDDGVYFIQKPFSVSDLTRKVRELLDRPA